VHLDRHRIALLNYEITAGQSDDWRCDWPDVERIEGCNALQASTAKCLEKLSEAEHRFSIEETKVKS